MMPSFEKPWTALFDEPGPADEQALHRNAKLLWCCCRLRCNTLFLAALIFAGSMATIRTINSPIACGRNQQPDGASQFGNACHQHEQVRARKRGRTIAIRSLFIGMK